MSISTDHYEAKFRAIFEITQDGMLIVDDHGRYIDANPAACGLLGMKRERIIGRIIEDFADPHRKGEVQKSWRHFLECGSQKGFFRIYRPDGSTRHVEYIAKAHVIPHQHLSILRDITERNQAELTLRTSEDRLRLTVEELRVAKNAAENANRAKSQFIANISHEVRTPINGMLGAAELLKRTALSSEQKEYAAIMEDSGDTLMSLVNELLDFSRIEAGKLKLEIKHFDLITILHKVVNSFGKRIRNKRLKVSLKMPPEMPRLLRGDPLRLRQILANLIGNAVKFTDHGEIIISVVTQENDAAHATVRFAVQDTGPGIPENQQRLLFKPFSQIDSSTRREHGGTGLGLAISKQLTEQMGGSIGLKSVPDQGSTFWFSLTFDKPLTERRSPSRLAQANPKMAVVLPTSSQLRNPRILVAEDNRINQIVVVRQLQKLGYAADTVANGYEVLKALRHHAFDLILMDCQMPRMDGYEATKAIRRRHARQPVKEHIPIIAMTAHAMEDDRRKCLAAGMDDYITKPVQLLKLRALLEQHLRGPVPHNPPPLAQMDAQSDPDFGNIMESYWEDTGRQLERLEEAIHEQSTSKVKDIAHYALGASLVLGVTTVAKPLRRLEEMGRLNELSHASEVLREAKEQLEQYRINKHHMKRGVPC